MKARTLAGALLAVGTQLATLSSSAIAGGVPVIDVEVIAKQIEELRKLEDQLTQLKSILGEAENIYSSFSQVTDVAGLLENRANRKYLQPDYQRILDELAKADGKIDGLTGEAQDIRVANRIVDPVKDAPNELRNAQELKNLEQEGLQAAQFAATSQQNLKAAEQRVTALEGYIARLKTAKDPKETLDLQAAIATEQLFLQNETIKMLAILQAQQAQTMLNQVKEKETQQEFLNRLRTDLKS